MLIVKKQVNIDIVKIEEEKKLKVKIWKDIVRTKKIKVYNKTIIEWETELSKYNRKTLKMEDFKQYCKKKNEMNYHLYKFYQKNFIEN